MPHALSELHTLLQHASDCQRHMLGELIAAPYGSSADALCDHISFLRGGLIGQFSGRDYKQLVTDVADRVGIDWAQFAPSPDSWHQLSAFDIERHLVDQISADHLDIVDREAHLPEVLQTTARGLVQMLLYQHPYLWIAGSAADRGLEHALSLLYTDWQKLLAAIVYIHFDIRQHATQEA